ncbi:hypothetical protein ABZY16_08735 [Streptomyces sp. NPDC006553]|uniref:hypothetical protein n=1 Tax=Streptomyces sp. NPDC006553 TaxID=3157180 RepID=UPI0033ABFAC4
MSYSFFLFRFADGEVAPMDRERFRQVAGPYAVGGWPADGERAVDLRAEDGGGADVCFSAAPGDLESVTFTHFQRGAMVDVFARLAEALGATIVPQDGRALIFHEDLRRHLPPQIRQEARVVAPTGPAVSAGLADG